MWPPSKRTGVTVSPHVSRPNSVSRWEKTASVCAIDHYNVRVRVRITARWWGWGETKWCSRPFVWKQLPRPSLQWLEAASLPTEFVEGARDATCGRGHIAASGLGSDLQNYTTTDLQRCGPWLANIHNGKSAQGASQASTHLRRLSLLRRLSPGEGRRCCPDSSERSTDHELRLCWHPFPNWPIQANSTPPSSRTMCASSTNHLTSCTWSSSPTGNPTSCRT